MIKESLQRYATLFVFGLFALSSFLIAAGHCEAQGQSVTVQLPTFHVTGVSTTVVVPDRGSMYLGGVNRSSLGRSSFGPGVPGLGSRSIGRSSVASGISINATIIDHDEMDRALLAEAARRRGAAFDINGRPVADAPRLPPMSASRRAAARARDGRTILAPPLNRPSLATRASAESQRAETYLQRARQAEADGQPQMAKIFYQRVVKHGDTGLRQQAEARIAQIDSRSQPSR